jgi:hypothetical protein
MGTLPGAYRVRAVLAIAWGATSGPDKFARVRAGASTGGVVAAVVLGVYLIGVVPAGAAGRAIAAKVKPGPAPNCQAFEGSVAGFQLGYIGAPSVTTFGAHQTTCVWTGQQSGKYAFVVSVAVFGAPVRSDIGPRLLPPLAPGRTRRRPHPAASGWSPRKTPSAGITSKARPSKASKKGQGNRTVPPIYNEEDFEIGRKTAIEKSQTAPTCAGQPGTEGDFLTAYGSPIGGRGRGPIEPMVLQISVACQLDALSGGLLELAHIASAVYVGRGY